MLFPFTPDPDALTDHEREQARRNPDRDTLELATAEPPDVGRFQQLPDVGKFRWPGGIL